MLKMRTKRDKNKKNSKKKLIPKKISLKNKLLRFLPGIILIFALILFLSIKFSSNLTGNVIIDPSTHDFDGDGLVDISDPTPCGTLNPTETDAGVQNRDWYNECYSIYYKSVFGQNVKKSNSEIIREISNLDSASLEYSSCDSDGVCDIGERIATCPSDCKGSCGNEICDSGKGESETTCPADCAPTGYLTTWLTSDHQGLKKFFEVILGRFYDDQLLITKLSFVILAFLVVWAFSANLGVSGARIGENFFLHLFLSIVLSVLFTRWVATDGIVQMVLIPYGAAGIALGSILPFMILFYLTLQLMSNDDWAIARTIVWITFATFMFYMYWRYRYIPGSWLYLVILGLSISAIFAVPALRNLMRKATIGAEAKFAWERSNLDNLTDADKIVKRMGENLKYVPNSTELEILRVAWGKRSDAYQGAAKRRARAGI